MKWIEKSRHITELFIERSRLSRMWSIFLDILEPPCGPKGRILIGAWLTKRGRAQWSLGFSKTFSMSLLSILSFLSILYAHPASKLLLVNLGRIGHFWPFLVIFDFFRSLLIFPVTFDFFRSLLTSCGHFWLFAVTFDFFVHFFNFYFCFWMCFCF